MDVDDERDWWDGLQGMDILKNAWGWPHYDIVAVARRIVLCLDPDPGDMILDLGCGPGRTALAVAQMAKVRVAGVDISQTMLDVSGVSDDVFYYRGDGRNLPPVTFDHAYSVTMFEHIPHEATRRYIEQIAGELPKGGRFIFSHTPGDDPQDFLHHQCNVHDVWGWLTMAGFTERIEIPPDPVLDREVWAWFCVERT